MLFNKKWLVVLFTLITIGSQAQDNKLFSRKNLASQYATVGIGGGSSHYYGDLSPYSSPWVGIYKNVRWNGTINYTRHLTPKLSARVSASYIRIYGDDNVYASAYKKNASFRILRNLNFRNDVKEIAISGLYNLAPQYGKGPNGRNKVMPYATFGIALFGHRPEALGVNIGNDSTAGWVDLKPLNTGGQGQIGSKRPYSYVSVAIPLGIGVRYKLNSNFDIAFEGGIRLTYFDYLDDVGADPYPAGRTADDISYRADELFTPRLVKGKSYNRITDFINASLTANPSTNYTDPTQDAQLAYPLTTLRGTARKDSYIVTQITLNYVIGKSIKCPPIR